MALTDEEISLYIDKELAGKGIPIEAKNWNIKNEKEVVYPDCGVPIFVITYPFNEETEVFIRKRYNMSIDVNPEEN